MAGITDGFIVDYQVTETRPRIRAIIGLNLASGEPTAQACQQAFDRVTDADRIEFASNRTALDRSNGPVLDKLVYLARTCDEFSLEIHGHTDDRGRRSANIALSLARATAVKDYLVSRGLSADRMTALGFGPDRPAVPNTTETGQAQNRRIEFEVVRGE